MLHGLLVGSISLTARHPRIFPGHLTSSLASFQNRSALGIHELSNSRLATSRFLRSYGNTGDPVNKRWKRIGRKKSRRGSTARRSTKTPRVTRRTYSSLYRGNHKGER
jgi:hypothetical protein